jgi:hypothetical protein
VKVGLTDQARNSGADQDKDGLVKQIEAETHDAKKS